jgi:1,4-dihydroxy-2-naphthoyl-CoA synthase
LACDDGDATTGGTNRGLKDGFAGCDDKTRRDSTGYMRERHDATVQRELVMDVQQLTRNGDLMVPVSVVCWEVCGFGESAGCRMCVVDDADGGVMTPNASSTCFAKKL